MSKDLPDERVKSFVADALRVFVFADRSTMGAAAAWDVAREIQSRQSRVGIVRMVFAAAPSQTEFLNALVAEKAIEWKRVVAFQMDEYIGLPTGDSRLFQSFLEKHLFSRAPFGMVHRLDTSSGDPAAVCERYSSLLREQPIDIVCLGIGENGHLAFNDPPVADFDDPLDVKVVELDNACRQQQVNDGCFAAISDVPTHAVTLTIPRLLDAGHLSVVVPGEAKSGAVKDALTEPVSTACPASILRRRQNAALYLDEEAASRIHGIAKPATCASTPTER